MTGPSFDKDTPSGGQPEYGAPGQQPYGQQQPYGNAAPYGGFGGPSPYGAAPTGARPPQVLAAAVLGFVVAAFLLLGALVAFSLASVLAAFVIFAVLYLALAAVNVVGGIQALQGKGSTVLRIAGGITAGFALLALVVGLTQGEFDVSVLVAVAVGAGIVVLLAQPQSKQYFAGRGTK